MPNGPKSWTYDKTKPITYIDDIIHESLRLRPPVSSSGYRVTSSKGLQIDEVFIPGDVNVFVPPQIIQTDERYYKFSKQFIPERWGEKKVEWGTDKAPYFPFSLGEFFYFLPCFVVVTLLYDVEYTMPGVDTGCINTGIPIGVYGCVGKNLAMLSLRVAISTLAQRYNIKFAPGETGEAFWNDALDTFTTFLPPLQVVFQPRKL